MEKELVKERDTVAPEISGDSCGACGLKGALCGMVLERPSEGGVFGGVEGIGEGCGGGRKVRGGD